MMDTEKKETKVDEEKSPLIRYDKEALLALKTSKLSMKWPSVLNKTSITREGYWDPVLSYKCFPKREAEREVKPKTTTTERARDDRDGIILGPQKRSWDTGCHVTSQSRPPVADSVERERPSRAGHTGVSSRREGYGVERDSRGRDSGGYRGSDRGNGWRHDDSQSNRGGEGGGRYYTNSSSGGRGRERGDYGGPKRGGYARDNYHREGGYNRGNRPHQQHTYSSAEPEWFADGPESAGDTIELGGISENDGLGAFKKATCRESESSDDRSDVRVSTAEQPDSQSAKEEPEDPKSLKGSSSPMEIDFTDQKIASETTEEDKGTSRFMSFFETKYKEGTQKPSGHGDETTADSIKSKNRNAQLFELIKGPNHETKKQAPTPQTTAHNKSAREVEDMLRGILMKNDAAVVEAKPSSLKLPRGLANGQVKTLDEIESAFTQTTNAPGNKGAGDGDSLAFNRLLGMMNNSTGQQPPVVAPAPAPPPPVAPSVPPPSVQTQQRPRFPEANHPDNTAALLRQQLMKQAMMSANGMGMHPGQGHTRQTPPMPPGVRRDHFPPPNLPPNMLNPEQMAMTLRMLSGNMPQMGPNNNALSASARISQLQNPDPLSQGMPGRPMFPQGGQGGMWDGNNEAFIRSSGGMGDPHQQAAGDHASPGRPLVRAVESDLSRQFSNQMSVLDSQGHQPQMNRGARPIVKTHQPGGPSPHDSAFNFRHNPMIPGSDTPGGINAAALQQFIMHQHQQQMDAKAAAQQLKQLRVIKSQHQQKQQQQAMNPGPGARTDDLTRWFNMGEIQMSRPPLPSREDRKVLTLDEIEGAAGNDKY